MDAIIRLPDGTRVDGAVAELYFTEHGELAADIRIPPSE